MILWLNGPFGVGKTTTAGLVVARDPRWRLFDPEWVGFLLRSQLPEVAVTDFQQYPSWRRLVPVVADEIVVATGQHLVAVQSVHDAAYWQELHAGLADLGHDVVHVVLDAPADVVRARAEADQVETTAVRWRVDHLAAYAEAMADWLPARADHVVGTGALTPAQAADAVAALVGVGRPPTPATE